MARPRRESEIDRFVGKKIFLVPLTQHGRNRVKEYGRSFTVTKVNKGVNTRYQVTNDDKNYQRWISANGDKHFDYVLQ